MQNTTRNLFLITTLLLFINSHGQDSISVAKDTITGITNYATGDLRILKGKIIDESKKDALQGVNVTVKGTSVGVVTDDNGNFELKTSQPLPLTLVITYIGYSNKEIKIDNENSSVDVKLHEENNFINEVVVSASRVSEKILQSPVSIEKLDNTAIKQSAAPSFFDALENLKGVQMTTLSLGFKVPNTRGFANTTNSRFLQLVDGADTQSPGIGAPIANTIGPSELDVQSVELIPGAASAIYGMNAINGVSSISTKDPFLHKGISIYQKVGINHINDPYVKIKPITETAVRDANTFKDRFAYKINVSFFKGYDWIANNQTDLNATANSKLGLTGDNNPGRDPVNSYGNENNSIDKTDIKMANGKTYQIARTGYNEKDFVDYNVQNLKGDLQLAYKFKNDDVLSYSYRIGTADNEYQRGNRITLDGILLQQHKLEWTGKNHMFRTYLTTENTGDSYNDRPMAENLDLSFKSHSQWNTDFTKRFNTLVLPGTTTGDSIINALKAARAFADSGRLQPGTQVFEEKVKALQQINNWDRGAALKLKTKLFQAEGQYNFTHLIKYFELLAGVDFRDQNVTPDGNSFVNPDGIITTTKFDSTKLFKGFNYYKVGGFFQATKKVWRDRLKFVAALRVDKVQYFKPAVNPRLAVVISPTPKHNFRVSWQNGFRFPTLFEGFSFVDNGAVKRLGGLEVLAGGQNIIENSYIRQTVKDFNSAVKDDQNAGLTEVQAIDKNKGILQKSPFGYIKPEQVNSLEVGYKGLFYKDKIFLDVDYYFNIYHNFIAQVEITRINRGTIGTDDSTVYFARTAGSYGANTNFRLYTNSAAVVRNQGVSAAITYNFWRTFTLTANYSWAKLKGIKNTDILIPDFNTPQHTVNVSIGAKEAFKNFGFNVTWRWQSGFYWSSQLAAGNVASFNTLDAQVNYRVPKAYSTFKLGGTNLLNKYYKQYIGGPTIGSVLYFSWTVDGLFEKK